MSGAAAMPGEWTVPASLDRAVSDRNQSIWLYIGRLQESFHDTDRALHAYENVLKHNQSNVDAIVSAGILLMKKEHLAAAKTYLVTAVQLEPTNGEAWRALAYSYVMSEEMEKAYHAYSIALANLQDHHDPNLWFGVGIVYDRIGRLDDALRAFDAVLSLNPAFERSDEVYYSIGLIYKEQGNYNMAHSYMAKIISINSSPGAHAEAWYQIGTLHDLAGNSNSATEAYQAALARNPADSKCIQALAWLVHKSGNSNKAVELLQRAMSYDESDGTTYYLMGRIYMASAEFRIAYDNYQRAVHLDGKNANFWCSIASLYYQRQQYRDAMDAYSRAVHINPEIAEIWYDLGILYEAYNQNEDAMDSYRRASELQPQNPRFTQRMSALRIAMANRTSLAKPTERPLTDGPDMSPTTRSGQRPHLKCDVIQRYGLLPAPPAVQAPVQQTAAMPTNQMAAVRASGAISDDRYLRSGIPATANGATTVAENGLHPSSAVANVSNGIVTHTSSVMQKPQHIPVSSHPQRSGTMASNGSGETMQPLAGKHMRFVGSSPTPAGVVASASYPSQMAIAPQQDMRGDSRTAEFSRAAVSPTFGGTVSQAIEQRSQPFSQGHPSSEGMRGMPQEYSQPVYSSSGQRNVQDVQSSPANAMTGRDYSQRDESKWLTASDRMSADSRAFPISRPEVSVGYPRTEAPLDRPTPGSSMTQRGAFSSVPNLSAPIDHTQAEQTRNVGAPRPIQGPLPLFTTTHSQFANGSQARYPEGPQSNSAAYPTRGTESSNFPDGKERDGMVGSLSHAPRPSVSDEPSRRSVSSSQEKNGHGAFRPREMVHDASNHVPASSAIIVRSQALSNGERVGLQDDASQPHVEHRETASRLQSTAHLLNPIREGQLGSKATAEKADSPVDEEMLPRLPPLPPLPPPSLDEQSRLPRVDAKVLTVDERGAKSPLTSRPENMAESSARQANARNGGEPKLEKEEGLGPHCPRALSGQDTRHHGPQENDVTARGNGFGRVHDNPSGSQSDMYGGRSVSPAVKREGMPIIGTSRPMPQGQMLSQANENGIVGNVSNGHRPSHLPTMGKSPEVRSTTAVIATEDSAQRQSQEGKERQLRTVSPLPSSSPEQGSSIHRPASNQQSPEHGSASRHSSGQLGFVGGDNRGGKQSESYDYTPARDKMQKSPQPPRVPSTGIRSSLQLENSGGLPTLKKPRLQGVDIENQCGEKISTQSQPDARNGGHVSSLRNPFGSGMSASFSKSLSRSGPSGPIGVVSLKEPGASETTARTANSEGLNLKTPTERKDGHATRDTPREEISGLGKRNASTYENGNLRSGEAAEYGRFLPKSAAMGPSIENKARSTDSSQQQPRFSGGLASYHPGLEGRNFGDGNSELNRPKAHHTGADSNANRFSGGDL